MNNKVKIAISYMPHINQKLYAEMKKVLFFMLNIYMCVYIERILMFYLFQFIDYELVQCGYDRLILIAIEQFNKLDYGSSSFTYFKKAVRIFSINSRILLATFYCQIRGF